ncbi:MAG: hypothetical protein LAN84_00385 [Acidobacteriia bacterium]|nr:hypothetical protein [Terriglobia bacterium]
MKTLSLEELLVNHERAMKVLARAVGRAYPIGSPVRVKWGRGEMFARVAFAPKDWSSPTQLGVISANGRQVHHVDYRDCTLIGGGH